MARGYLRQTSAGTRSTLRLLFVLLGLVGSLVVLDATPAAAFNSRPLITTVEVPNNGTSSGLPQAIADNQSTHHIYVVNRVLNQVNNFTSNGELDSGTPQLTGAPASFEPFSVAVDNSGGAHDGYLYAGRIGSSTVSVQQFDPSGAATSVQITAASVPPNGTPQSGGLPPVVNAGRLSASALSVNAAGSVFVVDSRGEPSAEAIDEFTPAGAFVAQFHAGAVNPGVQGIAIGSAGEIFLASGRESEGLFELDSSGDCVNACAPLVAGSISGLAIDLGSGRLLTTEQPAGQEPNFSEYDGSGSFLGSSGEGHLSAPVGIAIDESLDRVIVGDAPGATERTIQIYGSVAVLPDASTEPAAETTDHSATFHGTIGAAGVPGATCVFQYADEAQVQESRFQGATQVPCEPAGPFSGSADESVEAHVSGLTGGTKYLYRLLATNQNGSHPGTSQTFTTLGPTVSAAVVSEVTETSAVLSGSVNPKGAETTYRFRYVTQAAFEVSGYATAGEAPAGGAGIGAGEGAVAIQQQIVGLQPNTTYHLRVVAASVGGSTAGTTEGPDRTFTTFATGDVGSESCPLSGPFRTGPSALLPDCRAYEQATAVDKNGGGPEGFPNYVEAAAGGGGITFFSQAGVPGGTGAQDFPTFLARRGTESWSTQGLLPPQSFGPKASVLGYSPDLRFVVSRVERLGSGPGTGAGLVIEDTTDASIATIVPYNQKAENYAFDGLSADSSKVFFESTVSLATGAVAGRQNLYVWDRTSATVTLAGVLPGKAKAAGGTFGGPYAWLESNLSSGGAFGGYYVAEAHAISPDGDQIYFTTSETKKSEEEEAVDPAAGQLYLRRGLTGATPTTAHVSESQKTNGGGPGGTDPLGPKPAAFQLASRDGSQAFFLSSEQLTNNATTGKSDQGRDLYRYNAGAGTLTDLTPDQGDPNGAEVQGVLGASESGSTVYFVAKGVLTNLPNALGETAKLGEGNLYRYDDQSGSVTLTFIARLAAVGGFGSFNSNDSRDWSPGAPAIQLIGRTARVSSDGDILLFASVRSLTGFANTSSGCGQSASRCHELFRYSAPGNKLACVSCDPTGARPLGSAFLYSGSINVFLETGGARSAILTRNLSADGSRIFFDSPDPLVAADTNGNSSCNVPLSEYGASCQDVYEWEAEGSPSCPHGNASGGCLFLLSTGKSSEPSYFGDADEAGSNVFIFTQSQLVPADRDQLFDVYDARVEGGLTSQHQLPPAPCSGEECQGAGTPAPAAAAPGSFGFTGPGNRKPHPHCRKGFVRKHSKCVKRAHHKTTHHKRHKGRAANAHPGGGK
jgi:hypothetical protein